MTTKKQRVSTDKQRNYKNKTYVRMAMYPKTRDTIKQKSLDSGEKMIDWLDKTVEKAK